ncbi:hypothetical protein IV203_016119 [Nitzschia inconspicua]|uniref:Uncharacterized protein n=1 Tax=Nitzschia inconspicua TaxID=303405 RepID=A0A9K3PJQ2_9STRA|nr:hypothetical protein IV203_016119 [Nitzschia inconspicua]
MMCATTKSYQHDHVSMDDDEDKGQVKSVDHPPSRKRHHCRRYSGAVVVFFLFVVLALAFFVRYIQRQDVPEAVTKQNKELDDDHFQNTDDDSVFYDYKPEVEDEKALTLDNDGALNLEKLSQATHKAGNVTTGCETTILLMRHCEKNGDGTIDDDGNEHCDYVGHERANWLPSLFGSNARWPTPSYLYALSPIRQSHSTYREVETLQPLSVTLGLPIRADYGTNNGIIHDLFHVMSSGQACSKLIVVNWRHHMIPNLARKLGCKTCPMEYPEDTFDQVWELKFVWDVAHTDVYRYSISHGESPPPATRLRRKLKKKKAGTKKPMKKVKSKKAYDGIQWSVYAFVTFQYFDPLHVSGSVGDYLAVPRPNGNHSSAAPNWLHNNF